MAKGSGGVMSAKTSGSGTGSKTTALTAWNQRSEAALNFYEKMEGTISMPKANQSKEYQVDSNTVFKVQNIKTGDYLSDNMIRVSIVQNGTTLGSDALHYGKKEVPWGQNHSAQESFKELISRNTKTTDMWKKYINQD